MVVGQSILPDLTGFKLKAKSMKMDNKEVDMWYNETTHGTKISKYTMYITSGKTPMPHR